MYFIEQKKSTTIFFKKKKIGFDDLKQNKSKCIFLKNLKKITNEQQLYDVCLKTGLLKPNF
jgi:RNA recognition motif-containing protein